MTSASEPVDLAQVALMGDEAFVREMVELFLATSTRYLDGLRAAIEHGDASELARVAHALKGSSLAMHAATMAQFADRLEIVGKAATLDAAPQLFSHLRDAFGATASRLRLVASPSA